MSAAFESLRAALAEREPEDHDPGPLGTFAAVALVLVGAGESLDALLIRRARRAGDPWSGHVALPGGRRQDQDPDLLATACRETREEVGLDLDRAQLLGRLDDLRPTTRIRPRIVVRPYVFGCAERPELRFNHEVAGHLWTPLADLCCERVTSRVRVLGEEREVESLVLGEDILWGMTLRILDGFLQRTHAR